MSPVAVPDKEEQEAGLYDEPAFQQARIRVCLAGLQFECLTVDARINSPSGIILFL